MMHVFPDDILDLWSPKKPSFSSLICIGLENLFNSKEKKSLKNNKVGVIIILDKAYVSFKEDLKPWKKLVSYLLQMSILKAEVH